MNLSQLAQALEAKYGHTRRLLALAIVEPFIAVSMWDVSVRDPLDPGHFDHNEFATWLVNFQQPEPYTFDGNYFREGRNGGLEEAFEDFGRRVNRYGGGVRI